MTFQELDLKPEILRAISDMGFVSPTPVQSKAIPKILEESADLIALAQTGTGKTAAFGLPVINEIDANDDTTQCLVLCPTRELCVQIAKELTNFSKYIDSLKIASVYGGADIRRQMDKLREGAQIVVGTPGRTLDLIKRKSLRVENLSWLVLDEADEMLTMGFKDDLDEILKTSPEDKRTLLFSATMPTEIERMTKVYMNNPEKLELARRNSGNEDVSHVYYMVAAKHRYLALKRIADMNPKIYAIIFCRTRQETKDIADKLMQDGYNADALHGDLSQAQRDLVMHKFRQKHISLLVATDVAARGLDVNDLTHVINYNLPDELENYVHRSGRTGRAGKKGTSIAIVHSREGNRIKNLERQLNRPFERQPVPTGDEVCAKQLYNLIDKMENTQVDEVMIEPFMGDIYKKLEWMSREDLIKRFVSVEFNRFLDYYKDAEDINISESNDKPRERRKRGSVAGDENMARLFINLGAMDQLSPTRLIGLINDTTGRRDIEVGRIDIKKKYSFFDADKAAIDLIVSKFKGTKSEKGFDICVEMSNPLGSGDGESEGGDSRKKDRRKFDGRKNDRRSDDRRSDSRRDSRKSDDRRDSRRSDDRKKDDFKKGGRSDRDKRSGDDFRAKKNDKRRR